MPRTQYRMQFFCVQNLTKVQPLEAGYINAPNGPYDLKTKTNVVGSIAKCWNKERNEASDQRPQTNNINAPVPNLLQICNLSRYKFLPPIQKLVQSTTHRLDTNSG